MQTGDGLLDLLGDQGLQFVSGLVRAVHDLLDKTRTAFLGGLALTGVFVKEFFRFFLVRAPRPAIINLSIVSNMGHLLVNLIVILILL
jgi:hypothetical protein